MVSYSVGNSSLESGIVYVGRPIGDTEKATLTTLNMLFKYTDITNQLAVQVIAPFEDSR